MPSWPRSTVPPRRWSLALTSRPPVPPVIQPVTDAPGTPTAEAVEWFDSWLNAFATPWRAG
jgi:hypothetical protein